MPVVRRINPYTFRYEYVMQQRRPNEWVDAGVLFGNALDHNSGWKGYLIDGHGVKHQITAEWDLNEYGENNLAVTIPGAIQGERWVMYKTAKVTFHGDVQFFREDEPELPFVDSFRFKWMGNCQETRFRTHQPRAFRIYRKVSRT